MSEYNLREQLINSSMDSLKIDKNPFNYQTIKEFIEHINDMDLKKFYSKLFGAEHSYLNGMDRIAKVAEQFKPTKEADEVEEKAKELILGCETMNSILFDMCHKSGDMFEPFVREYPFDNISKESKAILKLVKPFCDYRELIIGIRTFQDSSIALNAFKQAIKLSGQEGIAIENKSLNRLEVKR